MNWSEELSIGVPEIDKQHQQLVGIVANYQKVFKNNANSRKDHVEELMGKTLLFLVNYANYHFEVEEAFMKRINYPGLDKHEGIHEKLVQELKEVLHRLRTSQSYKPIEFYYFVTKWLTEHIQGADMEMGKFYRESIKPNEPDKVIAQKPKDILSYFEPKFFKLNSLEKNQLISADDKKQKLQDTIVSFYSRLKIISKENLLIISDSITMLLRNGYIDEDQEFDIYRSMHDSIETDVILSKISDPQEKLKVLKILHDKEVISHGDYEVIKSEILEEIE